MKILSDECIPCFLSNFLASSFEAKFGFQGRVQFYFIVTVTAWIHDILKFSKFESVLGIFFNIISWNKSDSAHRLNNIKSNGMAVWHMNVYMKMVSTAFGLISGSHQRGGQRHGRFWRERRHFSTSLQFSNNICSLIQSKTVFIYLLCSLPLRKVCFFLKHYWGIWCISLRALTDYFLSSFL